MNELLPTITGAIAVSTRLIETAKKLKNAEINNLLADLSIQLSEARIQISELMRENAELTERLQSVTSATGELCPKCQNRSFEIASTKPHPVFGDMGAKEREYTCSGCGFTESKFIEP